MTTTVYFATNRIANHPTDRPENYTFFMTAPDNPLQATYGTAFVDSAGLTADTVGAIRSIHDLQRAASAKPRSTTWPRAGATSSSSSTASPTASRMR